MQISQCKFRFLALLSTPPAVIALLVWLSQTPLQPIYGFVLLPAIVLAVLAAGSWIDTKLTGTRVTPPLVLTCGDAANVTPGPLDTGKDYHSVA